MCPFPGACELPRVLIAEEMCGRGGRGERRVVAAEVVKHAVYHDEDVFGEVKRCGN